MKANKLEIMKLLVNKNWNIKQLAKAVPMDYIYLVNILNGKSNPSELMAIKISNALGVEIESIFEFDLKEA
ncbi:helix-turn-helix transcriptional regulator [Staphylococcus hominis]|uniref:helix-turn-helix transcriptional regulator n=1 Tax=Staphylococcus hominis TaxID=1290 RepID=UPI00119F5BA4|nr:helix-turn-helix transcriptional regulator [Staphylococcus hominis]